MPLAPDPQNTRRARITRRPPVSIPDERTCLCPNVPTGHKVSPDPTRQTARHSKWNYREHLNQPQPTRKRATNRRNQKSPLQRAARSAHQHDVARVLARSHNAERTYVLERGVGGEEGAGAWLRVHRQSPCHQSCIRFCQSTQTQASGGKGEVSRANEERERRDEREKKGRKQEGEKREYITLCVLSPAMFTALDGNLTCFLSVCFTGRLPAILRWDSGAHHPNINSFCCGQCFALLLTRSRREA